jgi:hypothetical protein
MLKKIQQYRPICLLNYLYKWITKVLTIRVENMLRNLFYKTKPLL